MLALILNWNLDLNENLKTQVNLTQGQEISDDTDIRNDLIESDGEGGIYERMGVVYKDLLREVVYVD